MNIPDTHFLELHEVAHLLHTRTRFAVELTQAMPRRIQSLDQRLHAAGRADQCETNWPRQHPPACVTTPAVPNTRGIG